MALYNKYRPQVLSEVVGQGDVVKSIAGRLKNGDLPHTFLFSGLHGTGKTTMARIVAKTINCENPSEDGPCCKCDSCLSIDNHSSVDVIEMDAAKNNGKHGTDGEDGIVEALEKMKYLPVNKKKILILDEVHMLSQAAFASSLKSFEEPLEHQVFILCTTDLNKVPGAIRSRSAKYQFKPLSNDDISNNLAEICKKEGIEIEEGAKKLITRASKGSVRDSLSMLEALIVDNKVSEQMAYEGLALSTDDIYCDLLSSIATDNRTMVNESLGTILCAGADPNKVIEDICDILMDVVRYHISKDVSDRTDIKMIQLLADIISPEVANYYINSFIGCRKNNVSGLDLSFKLACYKLVYEKVSFTPSYVAVDNTAKEEPTVPISNKEPEEFEVTPVPDESNDKIPDEVLSRDEVEEVPVKTPSDEGFEPMDDDEGCPFEELPKAEPIKVEPVKEESVKEEPIEEEAEAEPSFEDGLSSAFFDMFADEDDDEVEEKVEVKKTPKPEPKASPKSENKVISLPGGKIVGNDSDKPKKTKQTKPAPTKKEEKPDVSAEIKDIPILGNFASLFA